MRILYITPTAVGDLENGAAQRSTHLGRALSGLGDVTVEVVSELERKGSCKWFLRKALSAVVPGMMFPLLRVDLGAFDVVVVRYLRYAAYYGAWRFGRLYIDADDLPEDVCPRWARVLYRIWTRWVSCKAAAVWLANPGDVGRTGSGRDWPLENIPLAPRAGFRFECERKPRIITVANLKYRPNLEGIGRFLRREWPRMHTERPELEYRIIGAGLSPRLQRKWGTVPGVKVLGRVEDVDAEYEVCEAVACPVYSGSGTNVKVMEALARKRRLIAPGFAMRGIGRGLGTEARFREQVADVVSPQTRIRIPVVFSADDRYALPLEIAVRSLLATKDPGVEYEVIVLVRAMSASVRRRLSRVAPIRFVNVPDGLLGDVPVGFAGKDTWNRLLIGELLPEYERVLWSDADVLFKEGLSEVFTRDWSDVDWAGVRMERRGESGGVHNHFEENPNPYVYAPGFMVVNVRRWRTEEMLERFLNTVAAYGPRLTMADLDVLNLACRRIGDVGLTYCVTESLRSADHVEAAKEFVFLKNAYSIEELETARKEPKIVHYCGRNPKVWRRAPWEMPSEYRRWWMTAEFRPGLLVRAWRNVKAVRRMLLRYRKGGV